MKKVTLFLFALVLMASCNNTGDKANNENGKGNEKETLAGNADNEAPVEITLADFESKAHDLVGKQIVFTGLVDHTCKHGGKRMFLVDENSDASLKVESGENISSFDASLEGSTVKVTGIVHEKVIDKFYLDEWEADVKKEIESNKNLHLGKHEDGEEQENEAEEGMKQIKHLRKMLEESGKDHLSFYSVECVEYEVLPQENK